MSFANSPPVGAVTSTEKGCQQRSAQDSGSRGSPPSSQYCWLRGPVCKLVMSSHSPWRVGRPSRVMVTLSTRTMIPSISPPSGRVFPAQVSKLTATPVVVPPSAIPPAKLPMPEIAPLAFNSSTTGSVPLSRAKLTLKPSAARSPVLLPIRASPESLKPATISLSASILGNAT